MLFFANPAAFWGLLGLLVPLAIHLWNRRPGRVVPVGALRWLTAGANRRMRQLHLTQWPLLLLRLALLTVLVMSGAGPRWQRPARPPRPQVLISPDVLAAPAWTVLRPTVDSLRRRGAEVRLFGPGFPRLNDSLRLETSRSGRPDSAATADQFWARAAEATDSFPTRPLHLFTSAGLAHFAGSRPALPARLRWQLVPTDSVARTWLQAAARPAPDSLRLTIGYGDAAGTTFRRQRLAWPARLPQPLTVAGLPPAQLQRHGHDFVLLSDTKAISVLPVARPLRIGVGYDDTRSADLRYLRAALRAATPALPAGLSLRVQSAATARLLAADSLDWLLWLTDAPVPTELRRQVPAGLRVLTDAPAPGQAAPADFVFDEVSGAGSRLFRRGGNTPAGAAPLWTDAAGRPVLTRTVQGQGARYQLHTRLQPQWSRLPDDGQLPALLLTLLGPAEAAGPEPRALTSAQLLGPVGATAQPGSVAHSRHLDLRPWLVLAAALLFGFERLLVIRRPSPAAL